MKKVILFLMVITICMVVKAQPNENPLKERIQSYITTNKSKCTFFEVMEDMFRSLSEDQRMEPEIKAYISKINYLIFVECPTPTEGFYMKFANGSELPGFKMLMQAKEENEEFAFYKKRNQSLNEYLLVHTEGLSYIITTLDIKSISEMSEIMEMAGSIP